MSSGRIIGEINDGVVIDHIPHGKIWAIVSLLKVDHMEGRVSLGEGYQSSRLGGKKGILKIEGMQLSKKELDSIALVAENVTVNRITCGKVEKKVHVAIPTLLEGIIQCTNLSCISNREREGIPPQIQYSPERNFTCCYCDTNFGKDELKFYRS